MQISEQRDLSVDNQGITCSNAVSTPSKTFNIRRASCAFHDLNYVLINSPSYSLSQKKKTEKKIRHDSKQVIIFKLRAIIEA